jgi:hypothetical protein
MIFTPSLLSLSLGISRNRYLNYRRRICDNTVPPTPNMPIIYKLIKWQDLCVEGLVTASVAVSMPLSVDGLVSGNVYDLGLGLLVVVYLNLLGSRGNGSSSDLELSLGGRAGSRLSLGRRCFRGAGGRSSRRLELSLSPGASPPHM